MELSAVGMRSANVSTINHLLLQIYNFYNLIEWSMAFARFQIQYFIQRAKPVNGQSQWALDTLIINISYYRNGFRNLNCKSRMCPIRFVNLFEWDVGQTIRKLQTNSGSMPCR